MNGLALDLGTKTGFAATCGMVLATGTWELAKPALLKAEKTARMDRRLDIRIPTLYAHLYRFHSLRPLDWIFFEDVQFSSTTMQAQLWASLRSAVWIFAHERKINIECCPVGTLKKFATGYGGATKDQMMRAAWHKYAPQLNEFTRSHPEVQIDDNAIDALHLLAWGIQTVSRAK